MHASILLASKNLFDLLGVKYSKDYVEYFLSQHKDYPSLSSICGLLDDFNIQNLPLKIEPEQLASIPSPSIAFLKVKDLGHFVVLTKVSAEQVIYLFENKEKTESLKDFLDKWQGIVVACNIGILPSSRGNDEYEKERGEARRHFSATMVLATILVLIIFYGSFNSGELMLSLFATLLGLTSSILLLAKDLGFSARWIEAFCQLNGVVKSRVGCDGVQNSKASSFFGIAKMSEVGVLFFSSSFMVHIFSTISGSAVIGNSILFILVCCAIPYTVFSIYYQYFVVRQICPLCLLVIGAVWIQFAIGVLNSTPIYLVFTTHNITLIIGAFIMPLLIWLSLRRIIFKFDKLNRRSIILNSVLSSPNVLAAVLSEENIKLSWKGETTIVINHDGESAVTVVLSYFCPACSTAFQEIKSLAARCPNTTFRILFTSIDNASLSLSKALLHKKSRFGDSGAIDFLSDWYERKTNENYENYLHEPETIKIIEAWNELIDRNAINTIPTIYINGTQKPKLFSLNDFESLLRRHH